MPFTCIFLKGSEQDVSNFLASENTKKLFSESELETFYEEKQPPGVTMVQGDISDDDFHKLFHKIFGFERSSETTQYMEMELENVIKPLFKDFPSLNFLFLLEYHNETMGIWDHVKVWSYTRGSYSHWWYQEDLICDKYHDYWTEDMFEKRDSWLEDFDDGEN